MRYMTTMIAAAVMLQGVAAHAQAWSTINAPTGRPPADWRTVGSLPPAPPVHDDLRRTRRVIDRAQRAGQLSRAEARALRRESRRIDAMAARSGGSPGDRQFARTAARSLAERVEARRGRPPQR